MDKVLTSDGSDRMPAGPVPGGPVPSLASRLGSRSVVLVGLMGAGKTTIGRRLAARLGLPFRDADLEIESAAGMPVADIFAIYGAPAFRDGERRVIARLIDGRRKVIRLVLATGGGAYMNAATREGIARSAVSIWLKADHDTLMRRVRRRSHRPLLRTADPDETMRRLMEERYPVYGLADLTVDSRDASHERVTQDVVDALDAYLREPVLT